MSSTRDSDQSIFMHSFLPGNGTTQTVRILSGCTAPWKHKRTLISNKQQCTGVWLYFHPTTFIITRGKSGSVRLSPPWWSVWLRRPREQTKANKSTHVGALPRWLLCKFVNSNYGKLHPKWGPIIISHTPQKKFRCPTITPTRNCMCWQLQKQTDNLTSVCDKRMMDRVLCPVERRDVLLMRMPTFPDTLYILSTVMLTNDLSRPPFWWRAAATEKRTWVMRFLKGTPCLEGTAIYVGIFCSNIWLRANLCLCLHGMTQSWFVKVARAYCYVPQCSPSFQDGLCFMASKLYLEFQYSVLQVRVW